MRNLLPLIVICGCSEYQIFGKEGTEGACTAGVVDGESDPPLSSLFPQASVPRIKKAISREGRMDRTFMCAYFLFGSKWRQP